MGKLGRVLPDHQPDHPGSSRRFTLRPMPDVVCRLRGELTVRRRRGGRKRALGTRTPTAVPMQPNDRWSLDFASDQLTNGRRFRILAVVDDCTREYLALIADASLSGARVARELGRLIAMRGKPGMVVSDNGSELTSNAILLWADAAKVEWHYIAPASRRRMCLQTASGFASTFNPRRDLALRSVNGSAPDPAAHPTNQTQSNRQSELTTG